MIKPKTKKQKKQDEINLIEAAKKCAEVCQEFHQDMSESEFNIEWIRLGVISKMLEASNKYATLLKRSSETHTFISYQEDNKNKLWDNSTCIDYYK
tara:strand:+ start:253 stop:540 length:288 start_codon:yes stop_codon:yes gene_type:complete